MVDPVAFAGFTNDDSSRPISRLAKGIRKDIWALLSTRGKSPPKLASIRSIPASECIDERLYFHSAVQIRPCRARISNVLGMESRRGLGDGQETKFILRHERVKK